MSEAAAGEQKITSCSSPELAPTCPRAGVGQPPAGVREFQDRMLAGALRYRADQLAARFDEEPDDRMVTRVALAIAVQCVERAFRDIERADRSIHFMLTKPGRFTIADLQNAHHARAVAIEECMRWCDIVKDGADQLFGVDFVESVWFAGYVSGVKEQAK